MSDELLKSLGIDPVKFAEYARGCDSVHAFQTATGERKVACQLRGEHKKHKAIYHGFPMEWEAA